MVVYLLGWLPCVWFWRAMLGGFGRTPAWGEAVRAYYLGHLGKYVPGKAMVLVIRTALLRSAGYTPAVCVATAMYETLAFMGAGAGIAVALSPRATSDSLWQALPAWLQPLRQEVLLMPIAVLIATLAGLPIIARVFTAIATKMMPRDGSAPTNVGIATTTLFKGLGVVSCGWCLLAISLGCVLRSLGVAIDPLNDFPAWLAGVALSTVGGFVILIAPGGIGVREMLLVEVLQSQPGISPAQAFVAAWLLRAVWLSGELIAAAVLWCWPNCVVARRASLPDPIRSPHDILPVEKRVA